MEKWREIAAESANMSRRILEAAESRKSCEVQNAELATIAVDITDSATGILTIFERKAA
jgi:hypothetical protein